MLPLLLIGGVIAFLALSRSDAREPDRRPNEAEEQLFTRGPRGVLQYKPAVAALIVRSFAMRTFQRPSPAPNVLIVLPAVGTTVPPEPDNAYIALLAIHGAGLDIYAPTNAHLPVALPVAVMFIDPESPAPKSDTGLALLIAANMPFPAL